MAYTPKTWQCDDTITADELNRMEQGIAEASSGGSAEPLIVNTSYNEAAEQYVMDKTFGEIRTAFESGKPIIVIDSNSSVETSFANYSLVRLVEYNITAGESPSATGTVTSNQGYSVFVDKAPYTLEALDALYPSYN